MSGKRVLIKNVLITLLMLGVTGAGSVPGKANAPRYNPATEVTVEGTVQHLEQEGIARWGTGGTHLILNTGSEKLVVRLGPRRFLAQQGFRIADGDRIVVTGSKVRIGDEEAILARQVTLRNRVLTLRDRQGKPQWSAALRGTNWAN